MWVGELVGGIVVFLLGLGIVIFSWGLQYTSEFGPGPGFLPRWIGFGIMGCAVVIVGQVLRKHERTEVFFKPRTREAVKILVLIGLTFVLSLLLGFSVALGLFVGVTMRVMGKHRWISCVLTTVVTIVAIHFIFGHWLSIPLPTGKVGW